MCGSASDRIRACSCGSVMDLSFIGEIRRVFSATVLAHARHRSHQSTDLILRSGRRPRLEGWATHQVSPSFETPAFGGLLRMRSGIWAASEGATRRVPL